MNKGTNFGHGGNFTVIFLPQKKKKNCSRRRVQNILNTKIMLFFKYRFMYIEHIHTYTITLSARTEKHSPASTSSHLHGNTLTHSEPKMEKFHLGG